MPALITWWTQDLADLSPTAAPTVVAAAGADLLSRWTETHRRYHSTGHLVEMFWALEDLEAAGEVTARDGAVGRVAGWLHDAVYDPAAPPGASEAASAELARSVLEGLGCSEGDVTTVVALVRLTDGHGDGDGRALTRAFHDADLWILSAPEDRFDAYCRQVREEYAVVPEAAFRSARSRILGDFLRRDRLYLTDHGEAAWSGAARSNLRRELDRLA